MQTAQENKTQNYKQSTPNSKLLVIEREFDVPVEQLFAAFTTSGALMEWWWPEDLYADRIDMEFEEGGTYFINMKGGDQGGGGMTGEFEEIVENERIVMTDCFADEDGNAISAKEANMPEKAYITFEFESVDDETSSFILSQQGIPNELQKDCIQGWNQSFDKLENYLSEN